MKSFIEKHVLLILASLITAYVLFFSFCSIFRYQNFLFQSFDLAIGNQILWNLFHGSMDCSIRGGNFMGDHFRPVFFLYLPLYAIFPDPRNLLFLQSLILGLGAVPMFFIGSMNLGKGFGFLFAFLYLFNPLLGYVNLFEFHPEAAVTPLLLCAIYYFLKRRLGLFALFAVFALLCKENISFIIFMMGFWALFQKRNWKWYLATFALGFFWFIISFKIAIPFFNKGAYQYFNLYGYLGSSFGEVLKTFLTRPFYVLGLLFVLPNLKYLFNVFVQLGFLPVFSPLALVPSIPPFLQILLTHARGVPDIYNHYAAKLIPFLFTAAVFAVEKIMRLVKTKTARAIIVIYLICVSLFCNWYYGPHMYFPKKMLNDAGERPAEIKRALSKLVPRDANVVATFDFLPVLSGRNGLYSFHYVYWGFDQLAKKPYQIPKNVDYALIDFNDFNIFWAVYTPHGDANMRSFFEEGDWRVVQGADTVFLLKRGSAAGDKLYEVVNEPVVQNSLITKLNDRIVLIGFDMPRKDPVIASEARQSHYKGRDALQCVSTRRGDVFKIITYFQQTNPFNEGQKIFVNKNYGVYFQIVNKAGYVVSEKKWPLCYSVYPNMKWGDGEVIKQLNLIYIPKSVPAGKYDLYIGTFESKIDSFKLDTKKDESELILKHPKVFLSKVFIE